MQRMARRARRTSAPLAALVALSVAAGCASPASLGTATGRGDDVGDGDRRGAAAEAAPTEPSQTGARAGGAARTRGSSDASPGPAVRNYRAPRRIPAQDPPVLVEIPAIGVSSDLQRLGANRDGTVEVPDRWERAGWYADGASPGEPGSAVILGHVDSQAGPAVFARLHELGPGDQIQVTTAEGVDLTFVVERLEQHAKVRFPTAEVYYPTLRPLLRLVTCGGDFDRADGHYRDNVIVFARLAG